MTAVRANDEDALKQILGAREHELLSSGDATQDENARLKFLELYDQGHALVRETPDKVVMTVGPSAWPVPFPIVRVDGAWHFDATEGAQEMAYRRIGHNELDAIRVCQALYAAQKQYAATSHDGVPAGSYRDALSGATLTSDGTHAVFTAQPLAAAIYLPEGSACLP